MSAHADPAPAADQPDGTDRGRPEPARRSGSGRRIIAFVLAAAALAALAIFGLASSGGHPRRAPELPAQVLVGPRATLPALLGGSHGGPVLVVFWASWCGPCQSEAPAFARFAASGAGHGRIVGVNWSDTAGGARSFVRRYAWTFPNLRDPAGSAGYAYRITTLPTTFVIGRGQRIEQVLHGPQTEAALGRALAAAS